jgi:N-acyl-L-homoserine lactone synthetase
MDEVIVLEWFRRYDPWFEAYLEIKYRVFVVEQGWSALTATSGYRGLRHDPFDDHGRFLLARTSAGDPMGIVRGLPIREGFPHQDLFVQHLNNPTVVRMLPSMCTLNALAVLPQFRGRRYAVQGAGWQGSLGRLLVLGILLTLEEEDIHAVVATAEGLVSTRLFVRLGFKLINVPTKTALHPDLLMTNVGMVLGSPSHVQAQVDASLRKAGMTPLSGDALALCQYLDQCQNKIVRGHPLDDLFT